MSLLIFQSISIQLIRLFVHWSICSIIIEVNVFQQTLHTLINSRCRLETAEMEKSQFLAKATMKARKRQNDVTNIFTPFRNRTFPTDGHKIFDSHSMIPLGRHKYSKIFALDTSFWKENIESQFNLTSPQTDDQTKLSLIKKVLNKLHSMKHRSELTTEKVSWRTQISQETFSERQL